jgi:two-component system OmpR family sensor kinase
MIIEAPDDTTLEHARDMETALRRLSRLTEKLMQLARAEGGRLLAEKPIDIAVILRMVVSEFGEHTPGAGRVELMLSDNPVSANIDPDAFAVLARNLIENALKHGDPKEPVSVALSADGILQVGADACPPVRAFRAWLIPGGRRGSRPGHRQDDRRWHGRQA